MVGGKATKGSQEIRYVSQDNRVEQNDYLQMFYLPFKMDKCVKKMLGDMLQDVPVKNYSYPIIEMIAMNDGISQREINTYVPFDKSRISIIVSELIKDGYVEDTGSKNQSSLHLTAKGKDVSEKGRACLKVVQDTILSVFDEKEQARLRKDLNTLEAHIDELLANKE